MDASTRLSVAEARAIIGLPAERGSTSAADYGSVLDQRRASALDVETRVPILEPGSTLKSRFAALARNSEAGRKETRKKGRSLVGRRADLEERRGYAENVRMSTAAEKEGISLPLLRFQKAGRRVVRQRLQRGLASTPNDKKKLGRLGSLEAKDGDFDNAVEHFTLAAKGSNDDKAWVNLARAEVKAWERDPATGHERLRRACDAYRRSIDLLEPGFVQVWELPARLLEIGGVYESFGSFEGALYIYQRIGSSMPTSSGFEYVLFRCAVVMRYMSTLERAPRESLLQSALEHLDLIIQEQTRRKGYAAESAALLFADVCMSLAEGSKVAEGWAKNSYKEVFNSRKSRRDANAISFIYWDDWISSPETQVQLAKEWSQKGEPALAALAFEKALESFARENEISVGSKIEPPFDVLMDASEALASFQRFSRAEEMVRKALALKPENKEAKGLLREFLGDENCRRREMALQVVLHLQSKWRTRVWQGEYLASLRKRLQTSLEERLSNNRLDIEARDQLGYFFRDKHRPVLLYEDRCAKMIQRLARAGLFRLRWFAVKQRAYRIQLTNVLKLWQKSGYSADTREIIRAHAASRYTPANHKIVSVVAQMSRQDNAAPLIQRAARSLLARKMFRRILKHRSRDLRRKQKAAAIRLQCQMRRFLAKQELNRRVEHAKDRTRAAAFIQRVYRARALQWDYAVKRAQLEQERHIAKAKSSSAGKLQATWRMKLGADTAKCRRRAILDIQRSYRGFRGRKRAEARKHELVSRIQRQYRRHKERLVIVRALTSMRISREKKEARAKEVERRYRALEKERLIGGTGGKDDVVTPLEARRAARNNKKLIARIRAKGSSVVRARKWRLQPPEKSPSSGEAPASVPAPSSLAAPSTVRLDSFSAAPSLDSVEGSHTSCLGPYHVPDIGDFEQGTPTSIQDDVIRPPTVAVLPAEGKGMCQRRISPSSPAPAATGLPSGDDSAPPAFLEVEASVVPPPFVGPQDSPQSPGPPPAGAGGRSTTCSNRSAGRISPPTSSPALAAALACARGIGGRLGTPLGSPYPAPGEDWVAGCSAAVAACAAARATRLSGRQGLRPSAPGSRYFPPFDTATLPSSGSATSPVVFEMVRDAADDEEDAAAAAAAAEGTMSTGAGWHGLTLYRSPGISQRSPVFQRALQLETIAFSPDLEQEQHLPAQPAHGSEPHCAPGAKRLEPPPTTASGAVEGHPAKRRMSPTCEWNESWPGQQLEATLGRMPRIQHVRDARPRLLDDFTLVPVPSEDERRKRGATDTSAELASSDFVARGGVKPMFTPAPLQHRGDSTQPTSPTPSPARAALIPARRFESGDMLMVAGLLAHPESALKRLVLHRARVGTPAGRDAFLKCLAINKLTCLAVGGCNWFNEAPAAADACAGKQGVHCCRWWAKVCDTIRMNSFKLEELVVEGLDHGGDTLGNALEATLDDPFVRRFGGLASVSLVRCGVSDEGAMAMARAIWVSSTLTHVDLSANVISDVGVKALAQALAGDFPVGSTGDDAKGGDERSPTRCPRSRPTVLKTLDLGQNRVMDPGGLALGEALPNNVSLESLTVSYNFMMDDAGDALLKAAASSGATLRNIHCEGNLFDEDVCGKITEVLKRRGGASTPPRCGSPVERVDPLPTAMGGRAAGSTIFLPAASVAGIRVERAASAAPKVCCQSPPRSKQPVSQDNETGQHVRRSRRWRGKTLDHVAAIGCSIPMAMRVADNGGGEENGVIEAFDGTTSLHRNGQELDSMSAQFRKGLGMGRARFRVKGTS